MAGEAVARGLRPPRRDAAAHAAGRKALLALARRARGLVRRLWGHT